MYRIHFTYTTGSTFETEHGVTGKLDYVFNSIDKAKAALQRMEEHYEWENDRQSAYAADKLDPPSWWKKCPQEIKGKIRYNWGFNVEGNDGKEVWLNGRTYLGYFEYLEEAEIRHYTIEKEKDGMRFIM